MNENTYRFSYFRLSIVLMTCISIFSCGSTTRPSTPDLLDTPYDRYMSVDAQNTRIEDLQRLIRSLRKTNSKESAAFYHSRIVSWAYQNKHFGLALYAANELAMFGHEKNGASFKIGIIFSVLDFRDIAKSKLRYCSLHCDNSTYQKLATKALINLEKKDGIRYETYVL